MQQKVLELLKIVQKNNVVMYWKKVQDHVREFDMNLIINGTTLLHEVQSPEMLTLLLLHHADIRILNAEGKNFLHGIKKNLKAVLKEIQAEQQKKEADVLKIRQLNERAINLKQALYLGYLVQKKIRQLKDCYSGWTSEMADKVMVCCRKGSFCYLDKNNPSFYKALVDFVINYCQKTIYEIDKQNEYLTAGGYSDKKIKQAKHLLIGNKAAKSQYYLDKDGLPLLLYRGTTNKNDPFEPLSHFGTLKAANDRLEKLAKALSDKNSNFYKNIKEKNWDLCFQIRPVYLKMVHPLLIPDIGKHDLNGYKSLLVHYLLKKEEGSIFFNQLYKDFGCERYGKILSSKEISATFDFVFLQPERLSLRLVKKELALGGMFPIVKSNMPQGERLNREHLMYQRMIRYFEKEGYDGFIYKNVCEDYGSLSFITFHTHQVVEPKNAHKKALVRPYKNICEKGLITLEKRAFKECKKVVLSSEEAENLYNFKFREVWGFNLSAVIQNTWHKMGDGVASILLKMTRQKIR